MPKKISQADFVEECRRVHNDYYDYSYVSYKKSRDRVTIVCPEHGKFEQIASDHKSGKGCPKCGKSRKRQFGSIVKKFQEKHGTYYDYSRCNVETTEDIAVIVCPEHGEFEQKSKNHINGQGCPVCATEKRRLKLSQGDSFFTTAHQKHQDKYDYSNVNYINRHTKVEIVCPTHGSFWQTPNSHLNGNGCPECGYEHLATNFKGNTEDFVRRAKELHGDRYDYLSVDYIRTHENVSIWCKNHQEYFFQSPSNHLAGKGCPRCVTSVSEKEKELQRFILSSTETEVVFNDREIIAPKELDIYIPEHNLAIEFNGLYYHSTAFKTDRNYHLRKTQTCEDKGISLIHVYEDEWENKKERVKSMILNALGMGNALKVNARSCTTDYVSVNDAKTFCVKHHIQGYVGSSIRIGLYYDNCLVAFMGLTRYKNGVYDLNRYCTSHNVRGGFSKLLSHFKNNYDWSYIYTYAERRYSQGNLYRKNGFTLEHSTSPGYDYVKGIKRYSRHRFMKHKLDNRLEHFDSNLSEQENMSKNGYYRIYDCGVLKFSLVNKNNTS